MCIPKCGSLLASVSILSTIASGAAAAESVASNSAALQEIIVTAQRIETSLQETPISVTAVSGATLDRQGSTSLQDLSLSTPNLSIESRAGASGTSDSFSIRGMGVNAGDSSAAVGVYVDEVYFPSEYGNNLGLLDVDRVEVLRGPQGTSFGRNTIAGAVQYITVKPSNTLGGFAEVTGGNDRRGDIKGAINLPLSDQFAVRISVAADQLGGYVTDKLHDVKRGEVDTVLGRIQLRWTPTDALTIDVKAETDHEHTNGRAVANLFVNPNAEFVGLAFLFGQHLPLTNAYVSTRNWTFPGFNGPDYFNSQESVYEAKVAYQLSDSLTFKSISAYLDNRNNLFNDLDNTPLPILEVNRGLFVDKVFSQEFQLVGRALSDRLKWTTGLYYYDGDTTATDPNVVLGFAPALVNDSTKSLNKSLAVYGQATYNFTDALAAIVGLRYTREQVTGEDTTVGTSRQTTFHDTSPSVGLTYQAATDVMLYVKASHGFRAGGFTINGKLPGGALSFQPETAWTYEAGSRMEFLDHRLRINPTIFFTDWKAIQFNFLVPVSGTIATVTQNAGNAHLKGAELETQFAASDHLVLTASGSLLSGNYTSVNSSGLTLATYPRGFPGPVVVVPNISINSPLQQAPKYKYSLGANYTQPLGDYKLTGGLNWAYTASQESAVTISDSVLLRAYGMLNANIELTTPGERWTLGLFGTNLLNKYYLYGGGGFATGYTVGVQEGDPGRPREYGLTLRAKF